MVVQKQPQKLLGQWSDKYSTAGLKLPQLDWGLCGVFRDEGVEEEEDGEEIVYHNVHRDTVVGKVLRTGHFLVGMPEGWLLRY